MRTILKITFIAIALFFIANITVAQVRVITIGDSTMADYDVEKYKEQRGWGQMLPLFLKNDVVLINKAKAGRSSKSFYNFHWKEVKAMIQKGDYVLIQFGHNDEKSDGIDSPGNGKDDRGTAAWGQYREYLTKYVNEVKEKGGIPILLTSIVRADFDEHGKLTPTSLHNLREFSGDDKTMNYPLSMIDLGKKMKVPVIDVTTLTQALIEEYGYQKAKKYIYVSKDNTHLKAMGGTIIARMVADELMKKGLLKDAFIF